MSARNRPCQCGSGKRFKHCCGALDRPSPSPAAPPTRETQDSAVYNEIGYYLEPHRGRGMASFVTDEPPGQAAALDWAPPGFLVIDEFLDAATCEEWRNFFDRQQTAPAMVQDTGRRNPDGSPAYKRDEQRITEFVPMGRYEPEIKQALMRAFRQVIAPHFGREFDWMSKPGVLKYRAGGLYNGHADSEYWDGAQRRWTRSMDRDYSLLLYINDDYEGGTLYFPNFDVRLTPAAGMLVAFPSDHRYLHAAEPLISGERYAVVCWGSIKGSQRLNPVPAGATNL